MADKPPPAFVRHVRNRFWRLGRSAASAAELPPESCSAQRNKITGGGDMPPLPCMAAYAADGQVSWGHLSDPRNLATQSKIVSAVGSRRRRLGPA